MPKKRFSSEQIIAKLRQIEVQLAQGKSIALACKDAAQRRRHFGAELRDECLRLGIFYDLKRGSGRNRRLARSLQPRAAPLIFRVSATRTYDTGDNRTAATFLGLRPARSL
jgi:hypothetical protein